MSYSKRFYYRRVLEVQRLVLSVQEHHKGLPMTEIYRQYIRDAYHISYSTFNRWMSIPAAAELRRIQEEYKSKCER